MIKNTYRDWHRSNKAHAVKLHTADLCPQVFHEGESIEMRFHNEDRRRISFYVDPLSASRFYSKLGRDLVARQLIPDPFLPTSYPSGECQIRFERLDGHPGQTFDGAVLMYQGEFTLVRTLNLYDSDFTEWVHEKNILKEPLN